MSSGAILFSWPSFSLRNPLSLTLKVKLFQKPCPSSMGSFNHESPAWFSPPTREVEGFPPAPFSLYLVVVSVYLCQEDNSVSPSICSFKFLFLIGQGAGEGLWFACRGSYSFLPRPVAAKGFLWSPTLLSVFTVSSGGLWRKPASRRELLSCLR